MTITDQAFIKAYRHDAAEPAPAGPALRAATRAQVARRETAAVASVTENSAPSLSGGPPPIGAPLAERQPLSNFMATTDGARPQRRMDPPEVEVLQPGTTVASFHWPEVCRALSRQCGPQLDAVVDALLAESRAGKSLVGMMGLFSGCGVTTVTVTLAARLAARGRRIILVDAHFARPRIAEWLEVTPTAGWQEVLQPTRHPAKPAAACPAKLADAVVRARGDGLDLLALSGAKPGSASRLAGGLQAVVTAGVLRHAYELVLVDLGAWFDPANQPILLELVRNMGVDVVVAVSGGATADERDLARVAEQLGRDGCELLGTVENRVATPQAA